VRELVWGWEGEEGEVWQRRGRAVFVGSLGRRVEGKGVHWQVEGEGAWLWEVVAS
jgi:hypothetical protein